MSVVSCLSYFVQRGKCKENHFHETTISIRKTGITYSLQKNIHLSKFIQNLNFSNKYVSKPIYGDKLNIELKELDKLRKLH